ncbi:MAG TPA: hypothetical protein VF281_03395 [Candidatus Saccharimonadales bacterium]
MSDRYEINDQLKSVINHTVSARESLGFARAGLESMIDKAVNELTNERRPGILIRGVITDTEDVMPITLSGFELPALNNYAVAQGVAGLIRLSSLEGSDTLSCLGRIIPLADIPLTASPEYTEISLESVAKELAALRLQLCGTGIEG